MLPGIDGITLCQELRIRSDVPIIMLTARDDETSVVVGLEVGADDGQLLGSVPGDAAKNAVCDVLIFQTGEPDGNPMT
jgi:CheY-like chemotaxis protein